jgi:tetratricopeptide (TPR) repeat protein
MSGWASSVVQARDIHGDIHLHASGAIPVPRQLPHDIAAFTARDGELAQLDALVDGDGENGGVHLCTVIGPPGVGKTALAVHWAHRVKSRFSDGQLYANLRGFSSDSEPLQPGSVLEDFLRGLDVPADRVPITLEGKSGLFRSMIVDRRMLMLLDNARSSEQLRPLLPGSGACVVVVTGRNAMPGVVTEDGAKSVSLRPLSRLNGIAMLNATMQPTSDHGTGDMLGRLADLCGGLPLALRIVSQRMRSEPYTSLSEFADELDEERSRLEGLVTEEGSAAIRAVFSWSYEVLSSDTARVFRLLGLHSGPHITTATAAAFADLTLARVRRTLATLSSAHLLERTGRDRYQFHDLLRLYAAERAEVDSNATECREAVRRALDLYLAFVQGAVEFITSSRPVLVESTTAGFRDYEAALAWLDCERPNLFAAVHQAAHYDFTDSAWKLVAAMWPYLDLRKPWNDWWGLLMIGLTCARRADDGFGVALLLLDCGGVRRDQGDFTGAIELFDQALAAFEDLKNQWGMAFSLHRLGDVHRDLHHHDQALELSRRALVVWRETADRAGEAWTLRNLGLLYRDLDRHQEALEAFEHAGRLFEELNDLRGVGSVLRNEGIVERRIGRLAKSRHSLERALAVQRESGDRWNEACTLERLGETLRDLGESEAAHDAWNMALEIFDGLRDRRAARVQELLR